MDGAELVGLLRSRGITTPALILTARGSIEDRVTGLDAGAQDYLLKPFEVPGCWPGSERCCAASTMRGRWCGPVDCGWTW